MPTKAKQTDVIKAPRTSLLALPALGHQHESDKKSREKSRDCQNARDLLSSPATQLAVGCAVWDSGIICTLLGISGHIKIFYLNSIGEVFLKEREELRLVCHFYYLQGRGWKICRITHA